MRTTLNLDPDILRVARHLSRDQRKSLGAVVSELARRGLQPTPGGVRYESNFPVFRVRENAPPITLELVAEALDE